MEKTVCATLAFTVVESALIALRNCIHNRVHSVLGSSQNC